MASTTTAKNKLDAEGTTFERVIHYLNEYKELITAILFFAGGAAWVFNYFATKDELKTLREISAKQNQIVNCLLQKHVVILEGTQEIKDAHDNLDRIMPDLHKLQQSEKQSQLTETEIALMSRLDEQSVELKSNIATAENRIKQAKEDLQFRKCDQYTSSE
jgi:uncharacterized protein YacL (UPF0231 family)